MKKFFQFSLLILLGMVMMSCKKRETIELKNLQFKDNDNFSTLSQVNYPSLNYEVGSIDNDMIAEINHFSYKLIKKIFTVQDNQLFAPLSLYMALMPGLVAMFLPTTAISAISVSIITS